MFNNAKAPLPVVGEFAFPKIACWASVPPPAQLFKYQFIISIRDLVFDIGSHGVEPPAHPVNPICILPDVNSDWIAESCKNTSNHLNCAVDLFVLPITPVTGL